MARFPGVSVEQKPRFDGVPAERANVTAGTARSVIEGASLGHREEIEGAVAEQILQGPGSTSSRLSDRSFRTPNWRQSDVGAEPLDNNAIAKDVLDRSAAEQALYEQQNPVLSGTAEFVGNVVTGGAGVKRLAGKQGVQLVTELAKQGAGYGLVAGHGYGEEGDKTASALIGAGMGAGLGVAMPFLLSWSGKGIGLAYGAIKRALTKQGITKADRAILKAMANDEQTPAELREQLIKWTDATLPDVGGKNMTNLVRESRGSGGKGASLAENFFIDRMKGEYTRLMNAFKRVLGKEGTDFFKSKSQLAKSRKEIAGPMYKEAYDTPIQSTELLEDLLSRPAGKSALAAAKKKAANEGVKLVDGEIDVRTIDYVKRSLDGKIGVLLRAGDKDGAGVLIRLKTAILDEVDPQAPMFAEARQIWSGSAELDNALEAGVKFFQGYSDEVAADIAAMSDAQREFFRLGVIRAIKLKIGKTRDTNSIAASMQQPDLRERLQAIFPDEEGYNWIIDFIDKESRFGVVRNEVLAGSQTYEKLLANQAKEGFTDAAVDMAQGRMPSLKSVLGPLTRRMHGVSPEIGEEIVERTTNNNLADNLRYIQRLQEGSKVSPGMERLAQALSSLQPQRMIQQTTLGGAIPEANRRAFKR